MIKFASLMGKIPESLAEWEKCVIMGKGFDENQRRSKYEIRYRCSAVFFHNSL